MRGVVSKGLLIVRKGSFGDNRHDVLCFIGALPDLIRRTGIAGKRDGLTVHLHDDAERGNLMIDGHRCEADIAENEFFAGRKSAIVNGSFASQRRGEIREVRPHHAVEHVLAQQLHHVFRCQDRERLRIGAVAIQNQMRQIASVIGMSVCNVDSLDSRLLRQRQLRGEGSGVNGQPIIDQIAGQIVFRIGCAIRAQHFEPHSSPVAVGGLLCILAVEEVYVQRLAC